MKHRLRALTHSPTAVTVVTNYTIVAIAFLGSIVLARGLAPAGRGEYATLSSALALVMVLGELGQSGAVSYWVAKHPNGSLPIALQAQRIMLVGGVVAGALLSVVVFVQGVSWWLVLALVLTLVANSWGASRQYALLSTHPLVWNRVRLVQPITSVVLVIVLHASDHLSVATALVGLVVSYFAGVGAAMLAHRRATDELVPTTPAAAWHQRLMKFGIREYLGGVPFVASQHLDKVVLALFLAPDDLGQYVVALSIIALCPPLASGIATMLAPQIAGGRASVGQALDRVKVGVVVSCLLVLVVCAAGSVVVPLVFGEAYVAAGALCWWLIPAGLGRSVSMVLTGYLRGVGEPARIAAVYWMAVGTSVAVVLGTADHLTPVLACVALGVGECAGAVLAVAFVARHARGAKSSPTGPDALLDGPHESPERHR